ncbi:hypothetical protein F2Q69_00060131 [Brassica cretica]|uniref:Bulb-type lectin domain-containing protein n=1 Tax=Brassica cretica TaxID=69181 RepID=A0A8S9RCT9_BRACR|nr:hypothetical protein F2Q69_00060131 [Brassica cretica]
MLDDKLFPELGNCMEDGMIGEDVQEEDQSLSTVQNEVSTNRNMETVTAENDEDMFGFDFGTNLSNMILKMDAVTGSLYQMERSLGRRRDNPLSDHIGKLKAINSNLVLLDQYGTRVWWTNVTSWDATSNINRVLKSWRGPKDPSSGKFTYGVERNELGRVSYGRKVCQHFGMIRGTQ